MALRRRSLVTVTMLRRLAFVGTLVACRAAEPQPTPPPLPRPVDAPVTVLVPLEDDASVVDAAPEAATPARPSLPMGVEGYCPELAEPEPTDAGVAPTPLPLATGGASMGGATPALEVRFRTSRTAPTREGIANHFESRELKADVVIPNRGVTREVFRMTIADPVQCCAKATAGSLVSNCMFSGIDAVHGRSITKREGDAIVIRWCVANLSTRQVTDRGEQKVPLPAGTPARFVAPVPACDPKSIP